MSVSPTSLIDTQYLPNIAGTIYTASTTTLVTAANVTNSSAAIASFSLHLVPSGGSASGANQIIDTKRLAVNESYQMPELQGQALTPGDTIQAVASAASAINIKVTGVEFT